MESRLVVNPTHETPVLIIGGGIAGLWAAVKLAKQNIKSTIISYSERDRGGVQGATVRSVGAINTAPLREKDFDKLMEDVSLGQVHDCVVDVMKKYLKHELMEIQQMEEFKEIQLGVALKNGTANFMQNLLNLYKSLGGVVINGWVTRLVVDEIKCNGVQYCHGDTIGKILCHKIIIATGGYTSIFEGAVQTASYGTVLGRYLEAGGIASNLEFVFKHGYGKPDDGTLTPTEELPGAEVYNSKTEHVEWLEEELYYGRGTHNHLQAFKYWRSNFEESYYIDLKYCDLYRCLLACNLIPQRSIKNRDRSEKDISKLFSCIQDEHLEHVQELMEKWLSDESEGISYAEFNALKQYAKIGDSGKFRVKQIPYFSMGGISHDKFKTNLAGVYVSGEAMHDFGAHRVGGLPWGLYLVAGAVIASDIVNRHSVNINRPYDDFEIIPRVSEFDNEILSKIRLLLTKDLEETKDMSCIDESIQWLKDQRRELANNNKELDDAYSWLLVAKAILLSSRRRKESRGCFFRIDYPEISEPCESEYTVIQYDKSNGEFSFLDSYKTNAKLSQMGNKSAI